MERSTPWPHSYIRALVCPISNYSLYREWLGSLGAVLIPFAICSWFSVAFNSSFSQVSSSSLGGWSADLRLPAIALAFINQLAGITCVFNQFEVLGSTGHIQSDFFSERVTGLQRQIFKQWVEQFYFSVFCQSCTFLFYFSFYAYRANKFILA